MCSGAGCGPQSLPRVVAIPVWLAPTRVAVVEQVAGRAVLLGAGEHELLQWQLCVAKWSLAVDSSEGRESLVCQCKMMGTVVWAVCVTPETARLLV